MGKIKQTVTRQVVRKSQTTTDRQGKMHCKTCGAYIGNKGRKK